MYFLPFLTGSRWQVIFNREIQEMISWAHPFVKQWLPLKSAVSPGEKMWNNELKWGCEYIYI
jgi:hypothetical protein